MSLFRRAGQEITRLIASAAAPAAEAARVLGFTKDVSGTPQFWARSPDFARQVSGVECNIFDRPLVPHALDDEFESTVLNAAWTPAGGLVAGAINPYAAPASAIYQLHTNRRPSWIMLQSGGALIKPMTIVGNFFVWVRASFNARVATAPVNNDAGVRLDISTNPYDVNNIVSISLNEQDAGTVQAEFSETEGGVFTVIGNTRNMFSGVDGAQPIEAVGIQKIGGNYHGWCFSRCGSALYMGVTAFAPAIGTCALSTASASVAAPGPMIVGYDFIRFKEGALYLP